MRHLFACFRQQSTLLPNPTLQICHSATSASATLSSSLKAVGATAGLDARAAAIVMRCVRNTVNTGRTVVCTIHQPSIDIFEAFDDLLLMKSGGYVTYHGSLGKQSTKLIAYFEVSIW